MYLVFEELLIKWDIETIKDYNNKLKIFLDDNFNIESINERIKRWFRQIPNELDNRKKYKLILWTFPWQDTLNRWEWISYYLNKNNIFWLLMWIINYQGEINLWFNIFEKIKNDDLKGLNDQQNKFISSLKDIITRDTVHICYTTPMESLDKRRCPLVFTWKDLLATHCHLQEIEIEKIYTNWEPMDIKSIEIYGARIKGMNYKSILRNLYGLEDYEKLVSSSGSNYRDSYEWKLIKRERKLNDNTDEDWIKEKIQSIKDLLLENDGYTQTLASSLFND